MEPKMIKQFFKKITGIQAIEDAKLKSRAEAEAALKIAEDAAKAAKEALAAVERANKEAEIAKMTPKDRANAKGEPWVSVLDTHVNKDNVRNGFFELDWNDLFVLQLKQAGYGFDGDPDEQIVDRWFRDLAGNMLAEAGQDVSRVGGGFININKLSDGKAEVQ
jgi:alkylation response protein AidB-like acyl-CoA dehydrogenase